MAQILALYKTPSDPAAFDHHFHKAHIPLIKNIPGLRSYRISDGPVQGIVGDTPHMVTILEFDSMADLSAALISEEGQMAAADLVNFASGGVTLMTFNSKQV